MINRLVAENFLKIPFKGQPYFNHSQQLLSFATHDNTIRLKSFNKDHKDIDISMEHPIKYYQFSYNVPNLLFIHNQQKSLEIYQIRLDTPKEICFKKISVIENVEKFKQIKQGLILICSNNNIKHIEMSLLMQSRENILKIDAAKLKLAIQTAPQPYELVANPLSTTFALTNSDREKSQQHKILTEIYEKNELSNCYEKVYSLSCLNKIIGIYQNRFIINQKNEKQIDFYDLIEQQLVINFAVEGVIKFSGIKQNLLVIISNKENIDFANFLVLSPQNNANQSLISHKVTYEKGKGDFYQFSNLSEAEMNYVLDKKSNSEIKSSGNIEINENTFSILFVLNKSKEKIEMIKIDHSKLLKSPFKEEKLNIPATITKVKPNQSIDNHKKQSLQKENRQVKQENKNTMNFTDISDGHKKLIQSMIEIKMKKVQQKFVELQRRVTSLQKQLKTIHAKLQQKVKSKFNPDSADYLQKVFDTLTPQLQKYFAGMFKQIAGVVQNGVTFYNSKMAKEAQIHKIALSEIVDETYKITQELIKVAKRQPNHQKNEEVLSSLLQKKRKWAKETEQFEKQTKDIPIPNLKPISANGGQIKPESKVFVRADLNYNTIRKQS